MNTQFGIRRANKIETQFIPYKRAIWKAKRLTHYKNMEEAEKKLGEFKQRILDFQDHIDDSELALYQEKRYLMTLTLDKTKEREEIIEKIALLEKTLLEAKVQLDESEGKYALLYKRFIRA